ncbi:unnamed protein product, partial [Ascophyllum nodosum]
TGPKGGRQPNLGPQQITNPWARRGISTTSSSAPDKGGHGESIQGGVSVAEVAPDYVVRPDGTGTCAAERCNSHARYGKKDGSGIERSPASPTAPAAVEHAAGSCEEPQDLAPGGAMAKFVNTVKRRVDSISKRVGHGSQKQGV